MLSRLSFFTVFIIYIFTLSSCVSKQRYADVDFVLQKSPFVEGTVLAQCKDFKIFEKKFIVTWNQCSEQLHQFITGLDNEKVEKIFCQSGFSSTATLLGEAIENFFLSDKRVRAIKDVTIDLESGSQSKCFLVSGILTTFK